MELEDITSRRASSSDSETIQHILKRILDEYEIKLPENYSFSDIENLEEEYLLTNNLKLRLSRMPMHLPANFLF